tara:strand:+ start:425 stop:961 length:537 start_codon:yes stop_codon:yes gene_type:complete
MDFKSSSDIYPSQTSSRDLEKIKSNFQVKDNLRSENSEIIKSSRAKAQLIRSGNISTDEKYGASSIKGFSYPLELDGNGGIKTSSNIQRLAEQIVEILDTRIGERVYRQFFGIPETVFETISEDVLSQVIKKQIKEAVPFDVELSVSVEINEAGTAIIFVGYSLEQAGKYIIKYSVDT